MNLKKSLQKFGRKVWVVAVISRPFLATVFSRKGLLSSDGRILIMGKARRITISFFPPLARYLHRKYGLSGGCVSCGASCKLLNQCPHWDDKTHLCGVYEDRPSVCRFFPITPMDIKERDIVLKTVPCGFTFQKPEGK